MKKVIIAQLNIKVENIKEFLALAEVMVNSTNNEPGCKCYKLLNALKDKEEFFFYEEYVNAAAIDEHNASEHFKAFGEAIGPLLKSDPIIEVF